MLKYQAVQAFVSARDRLARQHSRWSRDEGYDPAADNLTVWTLQSQVERECHENFEFMRECGLRHGAEYLIIKPRILQFIGANLDAEIENTVMPQWFKKQEFASYAENATYEINYDRDWQNQWQDDYSGLGRAMRLSHHRVQYFDTEKTQGIFDLRTGQRMTRRREIIEEFWRMGFAAWRGRPLHVANIKWSGTREELTELTEMANKYWDRKYKSDVAKKIVAAYRSINRYAAWPGNW